MLGADSQAGPAEWFVDVGANVFLDLVDPLEMLSQNAMPLMFPTFYLKRHPIGSAAAYG